MARAIIVIEDGEESGKLTQTLLYDPPLQDNVDLTPAQAVGGHCFGLVKREIDKMCKEKVQHIEPELVDEKDKQILTGLEHNGPLVMGAKPASEQFKTPRLVKDLQGNV